MSAAPLNYAARHHALAAELASVLRVIRCEVNGYVEPFSQGVAHDVASAWWRCGARTLAVQIRRAGHDWMVTWQRGEGGLRWTTSGTESAQHWAWMRDG